MQDNTTGNRNTAVGYNSLANNTSASQQTAIGYYALATATTGSYNIAIGYETLDVLTTGERNVCIGNHAGGSITTGDKNVYMGMNTGSATTTGENNVFLGYQVADGITTGNENVCIGRYAGDEMSGGDTGNLYLARNTGGAGNSETWIHGDSSGNCYQGDNNSHWHTTSDRRLKKNITDNTKGLAEINKLRVTNFEYRLEEEIDMSEFPLADKPIQVVIGKGNEGVHTGIIAQEVEAVLPECINVSARGSKTVGTDPIFWALVNAVKELSAKVTALEGG
jgi:hypothetical protein